MTVSPATQEKAECGEGPASVFAMGTCASPPPETPRRAAFMCVCPWTPLTQRPRGALVSLPALSGVFVLHTPQTLPSLIFRRRLSGE